MCLFLKRLSLSATKRKKKRKNPLETKAAGEQLTAVCCIVVVFFLPFFMTKKHPRNRPHGVTANEPKPQRFDLLDSAKGRHHFLEERPSCRVCFPSQADLPPQSFMLYSSAGCESFFFCARMCLSGNLKKNKNKKQMVKTLK